MTVNGIVEECGWDFANKGIHCPRHSGRHSNKANVVPYINAPEVDYYDDESDEYRSYFEEEDIFMNLYNVKLSQGELHGISIPEYIAEYGNKGETLNPEVEGIFMNGGCAVYAMAYQELNPDTVLAADLWKCDGELLYSHIFCIDPKTGESFDARGKFASARELMNYEDDKEHEGLVHKESDFYQDLGHVVLTQYSLQGLFDKEEFTYDHTPWDIKTIKDLITNFKTRF